MKSKDEVEKLIYEILSVLEENKRDGPMGATAIARELEEKGFDIGDRAVRYHLKHLDEKGFTEKVGPRKGRTITEAGEEELSTELVGERVGFMYGKMKELVYKMTFDLRNNDDTIIGNVSILDKNDLNDALKIMRDVVEDGWAPSSYVDIIEEGKGIGSDEVPEGKVGVVTVCSVSIDGVLENNGVPVTPKFGGVLEVDQGEPRRFTDAISYKGTSIDPLEIFASKRMTSYLDVLESGSGLILANVREIPVPSRSKALDVIEDSRSLGLAGVLKVGRPGGDLYGLPVGVNRVGIAIAGGINSAVAVEESGIEVESRAMEGVFKFSEMALIDDYL